MNVPSPASAIDQTRGVVWGAERPESLITETLAFHDRRTENLISADSQGGHGEVQRNPSGQPSKATGSNNYPDTDLDQGLRPQGSAFVELYNPWSEQGQYPAELYSRLDASTGYKYNSAAPAVGVDLGRLSNLAWDETKKRLTTDATDSSQGIRRSPVWRVIVVEEWPNARNTGDKLPPPGKRNDVVLPAGLSEPKAYKTVPARLDAWGKTPKGLPPWVPTNPDFDPTFGSDMLQLPGRTKLYGASFAAVDKQV